MCVLVRMRALAYMCVCVRVFAEKEIKHQIYSCKSETDLLSRYAKMSISIWDWFRKLTVWMKLSFRQIKVKIVVSFSIQHPQINKASARPWNRFQPTNVQNKSYSSHFYLANHKLNIFTETPQLLLLPLSYPLKTQGIMDLHNLPYFKAQSNFFPFITPQLYLSWNLFIKTDQVD